MRHTKSSAPLPTALFSTALLAVLAALASCAREQPKWNILLIVVDTLRADHLSCYGYDYATTPHIDALAAQSLRFTHAQSPRAKTTPAMASVMTGLYPHDHGVRDLGVPLDNQVPVLADVLRGEGYHTFGVVGNFVLTDRLSGLARGFTRWIEDLPDKTGVPPDHVPQSRSVSITDAGLVELDRAAEGERPWFGWLHYMDPHGLYDPPAEHQLFATETPDLIPDPAQLPPHPIHRFDLPEFNIPEGAFTEDGSVDAARVRDLYDGEIHYADEGIGRVLDRLAERGWLENTIVVLTSDHGESLGEHRYWFEHGRYTYEATCRVPLLMRLPEAHPERTQPGTRRGDISLVDLAPTLVALSGSHPRGGKSLRRASGPGGRARLDLLREDIASERPVFSEKIVRAEQDGTVQAKAVRMGDWKLIRRYTHLPALAGGDERQLRILSEELYDLAADPGESDNLMDAPPARAPLTRMQSELLQFSQADVHFADLAGELQADHERLEAEDPEALRILRALGY